MVLVSMFDELAAQARADADRYPECDAGDVTAVVHWERDGKGLSGTLTVTSTGTRTCLLTGKPGVAPLRADGGSLGTMCAVTLEMRMPGYVVLEPGRSAVAPVSWVSWCGDPASRRAEVTFRDGRCVIADVTGPTQPECHDPRSANLSSSWFTLTEESR
jgi:hypothetical protein